eukprot:15473557-Alexandrium_andersonii.AAC.1
MARGQECTDPVCLANRDHTPGAVHRAQVWKEYEDQGIEVKPAVGIGVNIAKNLTPWGGKMTLPADFGAMQ